MSKRHLLEGAGLGGIDPHFGGHGGGRRVARGESLGMRGIRHGEHGGPRGHAVLGHAEVHVVGREQAVLDPFPGPPTSALSYESPVLPTDGSMPASASRSV